MTKINLIIKTPFKVGNEKTCKIVITNDDASFNRFVEKPENKLELHLGKGKDELTPRTFRLLIRKVIRTAIAQKLTVIDWVVDKDFYDFIENLDDTYNTEWVFKSLAENIELANYKFESFVTKKENGEISTLKEINIFSEVNKKAKEAFVAGLKIGKAVNYTRDLANTPANHMSPDIIVKNIKKTFAKSGVKIKVIDYSALKKMGAGLLTAVGQGAKEKSRLVILEWQGIKPLSKNKPHVLLGKGVTFDSGGLNVKPSGHMHDMHMDMTGAATVLGVMLAVSTLKLKKNVVAVVPIAENAISENSMRAGDIVTSLSGKTVEILHTDAEGRMILADAITYALKHYKPKYMIDVATLTGASLVALGKQASALFSNNEKLQSDLLTLSEASGDLLWPLPLWSEYEPALKGVRSDLTNIANDFSRFGGCIEGAIFLKNFADKDIPWAHIDIAPRMESIPTDNLEKGATGEPVRLLLSYVMFNN